MNRAENIRILAEGKFDLCIIGGGASGAGCALDAAGRGLHVALIEKGDFAGETSSKSTKLIHGGVRYLEQAFKKLDFAQLRQVRHGLEERRILLKNAPHLAHPLGLITPVFSWWEACYYWVGLKLYDWFAGKESGLPPSRWLSKQEALKMMPGLSNRIHSAVLYYDGQMDDARYCLALVQSAAEKSAVVANHLEVLGFRKDPDGKLQAAIVKDCLNSGPTFEVEATRFLNCTGPYADHIRQLANPDVSARIRPSKGVHLVLPRNVLDSDQAMLIPKTRDGRMVFALPFEGTLLLGTTDEPYAKLEKEPVLAAADIAFLLETLQPFVSQKMDAAQVKAGFGGIRPLLAPSNRSHRGATKSLLRDHEVEHDPISGLYSLLGGKWTTYRLMAQDAVDQAFFDIDLTDERYYLNITPVSTTQDCILVGSENYEPDLWKKLHAEFGFDPDVCQHWASKYGSRARRLVDLITEQPVLAERILPNFPFLKVEIVYAVREEMAMTIRDFLAHRTRLEIMDWDAAKLAAPEVAKWMGSELNWSDSEQKIYAGEYRALLDSFIQSAGLP